MGKNKIKRKDRKKQLNKEQGSENPDYTADSEIAQENNSNDDEEPSQDISLKRTLSHDDSDSDDGDRAPKKKKKKKQPIVEESTGKSGKKSIRQMKRERHAQRQAEIQSASKDQLKTQCLNYLSQWKHDKPNWKFMKVKQVWLFKNKFSPKSVPNEVWPLLLEYFDSAVGNIRKILIEDANKVIKQMDDWTEKHGSKASKDDSDEETPENSKPDETTYKRARDLLQCLQE